MSFTAHIISKALSVLDSPTILKLGRVAVLTLLILMSVFLEKYITEVESSFEELQKVVKTVVKTQQELKTQQFSSNANMLLVQYRLEQLEDWKNGEDKRVTDSMRQWGNVLEQWCQQPKQRRLPSCRKYN